MKPYYDHAGVTIYHGDCREVLPKLAAESVDLVLTDPPYGVDLDTAYGKRGRGNREYDPSVVARDYPPVFGDECRFDPTPLLVFHRLVLWGANHYADRLPASHCWFAWDRKCDKAADSHIGDCELAWTRGLSYKTVRIFRHMWAGYQRDSEIGERHVHPTQKPVALMVWCLGFFPSARRIIDPYMGSGPALVAAKALGRRAIGIEIEERYCEIAAKRLAQEVLPLNGTAR